MRRIYQAIKTLFVTKKRTRTPLTKHQGKHHHLKEIYDKLNEHYFENKVDLRITWYGNANFKPRVGVTLGSYNLETGLIRIHRILDKPDIPHFFVASVVYHEMLHHVLPPIMQKNQRRSIHHPEFVLRERQFKEYELARDFEERMQKSWFES